MFYRWLLINVIVLFLVACSGNNQSGHSQNSPAKPLYAGQIMQQVQRHTHYSEEATVQQLEGIVDIGLVLKKNGYLVSSKIKRSSGKPILDELALKAVHDAEPFPGRPYNLLSDENEEIEIFVQFHLPDSLTRNEEMMIQMHLANCWKVPAGASEIESLVVNLSVEIDKDGKVTHVTLADDKKRYESDQGYKLLADSAISAMEHCTPLHLPLQKYSKWHKVELRFNASNKI